MVIYTHSSLCSLAKFARRMNECERMNEWMIEMRTNPSRTSSANPFSLQYTLSLSLPLSFISSKHNTHKTIFFTFIVIARSIQQNVAYQRWTNAVPSPSSFVSERSTHIIVYHFSHSSNCMGFSFNCFISLASMSNENKIVFSPLAELAFFFAFSSAQMTSANQMNEKKSWPYKEKIDRRFES